MLHKEIPFLRLCIPLCIGIISGLYFDPGYPFVIIAAFSSFVLLILSFRHKSPMPDLHFGVAISVIIFLCGLFLYLNEKDSLTSLKSEQIIISGTLSDYPDIKDNTYLLKIKMDSGQSGMDKITLKGSILIYCKKDTSVLTYQPGDIIRLKCVPLEITSAGNPFEFDYRFFMENKGFKYYGFISSGNILSHSSPAKRKAIYKALIIREKIIEMYRERGIEGERLALVSAMTLGQKDMLDQEQKQNFMKAGVMHIMAVSGLHAIILSIFIFNLLFFLKGKYNIIRVIITLIILWCFAYVTGLTPSVLRATLMFTFLQIGNLMKRNVNSVNSVLASAFVLILIRPSVIFEAGFLLSYSAVIFIILFYRDLYNKLIFKNMIADKIWQSAAVTLIAQAGTLPLTIMLFNRFPSYFLLTNIIIVPLSSVLIILGCLVPLTFPLMFLSRFFAQILSYLTVVIDWLTEIAASAKGSTIENIGMTVPACILLTIFIFFTLYYILRKPRISAIIPLASLLILVIAGTLREVRLRFSNELIVYNSREISSAAIRTGKILNVFSDSSIIPPVVIKHASTLHLKVVSKTLTDKSYSINVAGRRLYIGSQVQALNNRSGEKEIFIFNGIVNKKMPELKNPETIVIMSGVSYFETEVDKNKVDSIHITRKAGAYIRKLESVDK